MEAARARPARIDLCRRDSSRKAPHRLGCDSRSAGAPSISRPPTSSVHALAKRHDTYRYRVLRKRERASCTRYDLRAHDALAQIVEHDDARDAAELAERALVQLRPHAR